MKNYFPQKYCLISGFEAFLAKRETMSSPAEKIYKIGFMVEEKPIAIKTGVISLGSEISLISVSESLKTSSSSFEVLIPLLCNWVMERCVAWSKEKFKFISFQFVKDYKDPGPDSNRQLQMSQCYPIF